MLKYWTTFSKIFFLIQHRNTIFDSPIVDWHWFSPSTTWPALNGQRFFMLVSDWTAFFHALVSDWTAFSMLGYWMIGQRFTMLVYNWPAFFTCSSLWLDSVFTCSSLWLDSDFTCSRLWFDNDFSCSRLWFASLRSCEREGRKTKGWLSPGMMMPATDSGADCSPASMACTRIFCIRTWATKTINQPTASVLKPFHFGPAPAPASQDGGSCSCSII